MSESVRWYAAVLLLGSEIVGATGGQPLVEHQVRLIQAPDPEAAYERAQFLGRSEEHSYENLAGHLTRWRFLGLHDLAQLDAPPTDQSEVYSFHQTKPDAWPVQSKERLSVFFQAAHGSARASDLLR